MFHSHVPSDPSDQLLRSLINASLDKLRLYNLLYLDMKLSKPIQVSFQNLVFVLYPTFHETPHLNQ
ncbi:hypothetical protein Lalb_Chr20g0111921 [Lupinus albus]|uniref:Uncharacterized protein n=1 Tax=Lupinus albus TaxID=3870 RepID=A0A6A4NJ98_LUPAL|nr:hypothetical protein Lalb_Chr20g0111921 [Lupinus albus]